MRIIAFDSSLARSAWAAYNPSGYFWDAQSFIKADDKRFPDLRFSAWRQWAGQALDDVQPEVVIYEVPTTHGQGKGEAQIMLMMTLRELCAVRQIPVVSIYPAHLKKHVAGDGKAEKKDMMRAVSLRVPEYSIWEDIGGDVADALGMLLWYQDGAPESDAAKAKAKRKARKKAVAA